MNSKITHTQARTHTPTIETKTTYRMVMYEPSRARIRTTSSSLQITPDIAKTSP